MKKSFLSIISNLTVLIISILFAACNENNVSSGSNDDTKKSDSLKNQVNNTGTPALNDNLDVLFIETSAFMKGIDTTNWRNKKNKATFSFFITNPDSLTLHGWKNDSASNKFSPVPDIMLFNGIHSTHVRDGNYLSNSVLYNKKIDSLITRQIRNPKKYIVFIPEDPMINNNYIIYRVRRTNKDPRTFTLADLARTDADDEELTNPSPPRNSN